MTVPRFPEGPSLERQALDKVSTGIATLQRMLKVRQLLKQAARWDKPGTQWTEEEKRAAEHQCNVEIEALETAILTLEVMERVNG